MYKEIVKGWVKHLDFMIIDTISLEISLLIAYRIRNNIQSGVILPEIYRTLAVMIIIMNICVVFFGNSYESIIRRGYLVELKKVMIHCAWIVVGIIVWMFSIKQSSEYSRIVVMSMYPISVSIMTITRLTWKRILRIRIHGNKESRKIMVVTTKDRAEQTLTGLLQPYRDYKIVAVVLYDSTDNHIKTIHMIPVVSGKNQIIQYVRENVVDEVFVDLKGHEESSEKLSNILVSMGFVVHINLTQFTSNMENKKVQGFGKYVVLSSG
ncbi:MAG: nucleoside-diphosphate sugar epimerase/dehydratase, partial [Dorea sp.]